jgi:hypothetical protein
MSRASLALVNLRAVVILIVLAFHSVLPYLAFLPPTPHPFERAPYLWLAVPIIDSQRWFGFDLFCARQDVGLGTDLFAIGKGMIVFGWTLIMGWSIAGALPVSRLNAPYAAYANT